MKVRFAAVSPLVASAGWIHNFSLLRFLFRHRFLLAVCAFAGATTAQAQSSYEPYSLRTFAGLARNPRSADGARVFAKFSPNVAEASQPRQFSLADRVVYQRAIEEVYWRHRIWPKERPDPKPSLDEMMPTAQLEQKVGDYLRNSQALEDYWQQPVSAEQLQAEMERMAQHTRQPQVLRELFAVLGNDPFVIAECLARPTLSERLVTNHLELATIEWRKEPFESWRARAENQMPRVMVASAADYTLPTISETVNGFIEDTRIASSTNNASTPAPGCTDDTWTTTTTTNTPTARLIHTAVWTGSEMIVWGGIDGPSTYVNTGGKYNPSTDSWIATSTTNAPDGRAYHTAVWTGSEMIVWGGFGIGITFNTGGRYNPGTDSWTATTTTNAPTARHSHTALWTGGEMIVWGGSLSGGNSLNTGGRYNPGTDSWTATTTTNAPTSRASHTALWTGSEMIVWGGGNTNFNTGGRYNPSTDSWTATSTTNAPAGRYDHTAVWTDSEMIVWGGYNGGVFDTGGRYNPGTDSWTAMSTANAPTARDRHTAVWTGSEMIVWGGLGASYSNTGGRYNPGTDSWTATTTSNAPIARNRHKAVWTGSEMIVWGGDNGNSFFSTGGRYCAHPPPTPTPTPTPTPSPSGAPGSFTLSNNAPVCDHNPPSDSPAVTLNWTMSDGANSYEIYRNGTKIYPANGTYTGITFYNNGSGLFAGQSYSYFILARNAAGTTQSNNVNVAIPANVCSGGGISAPVISSVSPNPVPGSNSTQPFTVIGSNFTGACVVNLRDVSSGTLYPNRRITALTSSQINLNPVFGIEAHDWTVEVVNGNTSSGPFPFRVAGGNSPALSVTTVTTTNFLAVKIGSSADLTFTVTNVGSGTLSGTASVSSPFSVIPSASYTLAAGQQQTVTVRYSPTAIQSDSASLVFTGGGGATRQVTGSGTTDAATAFGSIAGRVTDPSGNPVSGARVVARGQSDYSKTSPSSSDSGTYTLSGLLPGTGYLVQVFTDGQKFYLKEIPNVNVAAGQVTTLNIQLQPVPAAPPPTFGANEIPVVLVRGRGADADWYQKDYTYWQSIRVALEGSDPLSPPPVRAVWDCNRPEADVNNGHVINGELTIGTNAGKLLTYIQAKANQFKRRWGVYPPPIDIVTHSMGGLIVRQALGKKDYIPVTDPDTKAVYQLPVRRVVMLAPLNAGTVLSDIAQFAPLVPFFGSYLVYIGSDWLSTKDLQTHNIRYNFDGQYPWPAKVQLYLLAATGGSVSPDAGLRWGSKLMLEASHNIEAEKMVDGAVSRPSVPGTWYEPSTSLTGVYSLTHGKFEPMPVLNQTDVEIGGGSLDHYSILNSASVIAWLKNILTGTAQSSSTRSVWHTSTESQSETSAAPGLQELELTTGSVNSGATSEIPMQCDAASQLRVNVVMSDAAATIRLRDPTGVIIDSSGSSSVQYSSIPDPDSGSIAVQFTATNPATGAWTVIVDASSVSAKSLRYQLSAYGDSSVGLIPKTAPLLNKGREALLSCTVADLSSQPATGMPGVKVTADVTLPDSTVTNLVLLDDGLHGDGQANDGTYAAGLSDTTQSGTYRVIYRVTGTDGQSRLFQRATSKQFSVSTNAGSLGGGLSHTLLDVDSNGTLDVVRLQTLVTVNIPGSYVLSGELVNASGTLRIATSANLDNMAAGTTTATLLFNLPQDTSSLGELHLENLQLFKQQDEGNSWLDTYSQPYKIILPSPTPGLVGNVSTRLPVGKDDNALIQGFIVQGPAGSTKKIIVRALGPFLQGFGITDFLANPTLDIFDESNVKVASNDDWKTTQIGGLITGDQFAELNASGLAPTKDLESAIVANLAPGQYTAVVRGSGNTVGTGLVDAFDISGASPARLANVGTRGLVQPGDGLLTAGFIVQNGSVRVVIRAIGPSLIAFGITNALPDTTLQLRDVNGAIVLENDDWMTDQKAELEATGLQPTNSKEAALVQTIPPGQYTAQVRGKPEGTGIGVVEVYFLQ